MMLSPPRDEGTDRLKRMYNIVLGQDDFIKINNISCSPWPFITLVWNDQQPFFLQHFHIIIVHFLFVCQISIHCSLLSYNTIMYYLYDIKLYVHAYVHLYNVNTDMFSCIITYIIMYNYHYVWKVTDVKTNS